MGNIQDLPMSSADPFDPPQGNNHEEQRDEIKRRILLAAVTVYVLVCGLIYVRGIIARFRRWLQANVGLDPAILANLGCSICQPASTQLQADFS